MFKTRFISMLVLLTAAVTGVWADDEAVTYALKTSDSFTSGQTVEVKNAANDVVATITYGESGGANFNKPKKDNHVEGFEAYTEGNGTNGDKTGGTFYTITPKVNATITVAVMLNADKAFYILEDGTALANYDGITVSSKYYGTYEFDATANKAYKFYCAGSKLGFYGFKMTNITKASGDPNAEPATYKVTLAEGTEDADKWTFTPAEAATTGVDKGTKVTVKYGGEHRVKSVTAVVK